MPSARRSFLLRSAAILGAIALVPASTSAVTESESETYKQLDLFMDVFQRVRSSYVEKVDDATLIKGAIEGMLSSLDPHSSYLDARDFTNLRTQTEGSYGGLGLSVTLEEGVVKVIAPTDDTPAAKAGRRAAIRPRHLGANPPPGPPVGGGGEKGRAPPHPRVNPPPAPPGGAEPMELTLNRAIIDIKPVKWSVKDNVGVIKIVSFSADTGADVQSAIRSIDRSLGHKPTGYVIDLRSNPGGLLDEAVNVSDAFLDRGEIVSQRGRMRGDNRPYYARPGDDAQGLPVVVLIDAGSASASEIVAGALQDHHRALVMGERSFGKGSVQTLLPLSPETALRLTTARYYTPSGKSVQEGGIEPDILVPQLSDPDYAKRPRYRESDLRKHLINEAKLDRTELEADTNTDPKFTATADDLKKQGIEDFQLHYALQTIGRLGAPVQVAAAVKDKKASKQK